MVFKSYRTDSRFKCGIKNNGIKSETAVRTLSLRFACFFVCSILIATCLSGTCFSSKMTEETAGDLLRFSSALSLTVSAEAADDTERAITQQVIVRFDTVSDLFYDPAEQAAAILSYNCEIPYVVIDSNPEAAANINSVLSAYHANYIPGTEGVSTAIDNETYMLSLAEDYYTAMSGSLTETSDLLFSFSHRSYVTRCDDSLIVFSFSDYTKYPEGSDVQPSVVQSSVLAFDAKTGNQIDLTQTDISDPVLYPASEQKPDGYFQVVTAQQAAEDSSTETENVIDLVEVDPDGGDYYMRVSGEIYDVRFSDVVYYDRCYEKTQLWYCNIMNSEALQLKFTLPTGTPNLKVSFSSPSFSEEASEYVFTIDGGSGLLSLKNPDNLNSVG